ncbi:MAG TPA: carbonic anhydrase [Thermoanaerobaculia bacterium]|nr:carbonic anhydrase [Thermoanaerobaculia bacterium]
MTILAGLLERNRAWSQVQRARDPEFFERLYRIQKPDFLWIGCADSRVPANEITGTAPGEVFVHRNIANLVAGGDTNCMAVVQYAIEVLNIRHVIVCGHYGCGGVRAVLEGSTSKISHVDRWLTPLRHLASRAAAELDAWPDVDERANRLCELNVIEQVERLGASDVVRTARLRGTDVRIYGLVYDLRDGLLHELKQPS